MIAGIAQLLQADLPITGLEAQQIELLLRKHQLWLDSFGVILRQNTEKPVEATAFLGKRYRRFDPADIAIVVANLNEVGSHLFVARFVAQTLAGGMDPRMDFGMLASKILDSHGRRSEASDRILGIPPGDMDV